MRQARHWQMKSTPDVLIVPSRLNQIAREMESTVIINPGFLAKNHGGGTFADITIHPIKESELRDAVIAGKSAIPNKINTRTSVDIIRI